MQFKNRYIEQAKSLHVIKNKCTVIVKNVSVQKSMGAEITLAVTHSSPSSTTKHSDVANMKLSIAALSK